MKRNLNPALLFLAVCIGSTLAPTARSGAAVTVQPTTAEPTARQDSDRLMREGRSARSERPADALQAYEQALALRLRDPTQAAGAAVSAFQVAALKQEMQRWAEAEAGYRQALALDETAHGPDNLEVANDLYALAGLLNSQGRFDEAIIALDRTQAIREKRVGIASMSVAEVLATRADRLNDMGRYAEALAAAQRALRIREARFAPNEASIAESLAALAHIYESMGRYRDALPLHQRVVAINETLYGADSISTAEALNNMAIVLDDMGRKEESVAVYQRVLAIYRKIGAERSLDYAVTTSNLAYVYREMARNVEALALFEQALAMKEQFYDKSHPDIARGLRHIATVYLALGKPAEARAPLERALLIMSQQGPARPVLLAQVQRSTAEMYKALNQPELAILYGKLSINTWQAMRIGMKAMEEQSQRSFLEKNAEVYRDVAGWLIDSGRMTEAQQILSMLKEEEYHEFIRRDATADGRTTSVSLTASEQGWADRFRSLDGTLFRLAEEQRLLKKKDASAAGLDTAEVMRLQVLERELDVAGRAFAAAMDEISKSLRLLARDNQEHRAMDENMRGVVGKLGDGVVLLHTITMPDHIRLLVTHAETRKAYKVAITEQALNQKIQVLLQILRSPVFDPRPAAAALYDVLIRPIEADLAHANVQVLMVSLDGALRYVPMAVLYDGRQYLTERYGLSVFSDAARDGLGDRPKPNWRVVGLGVSQPHKVGAIAFAALPAVPLELAGIVRDGASPEGTLPGVRLLDGQFSAETLRSALARNPPVVHIASHFNFVPGTERDSFLLLGDGTALSLHDLRTDRYSLNNVDLLTLSACDTGVGGTGRGDEVEGLAVTAQRKGAKAVIATMWPVADNSTGAFMQRFYQLHEMNLNKAQAMQRAQLEMLAGTMLAGAGAGVRSARAIAPAGSIAAPLFVADAAKPFAHPFFWAPFVLMGNWL